MKMKKSLGLLLLSVLCLNAGAIDNKGITFSQLLPTVLRLWKMERPMPY